MAVTLSRVLAILAVIGGLPLMLSGNARAEAGANVSQSTSTNVEVRSSGPGSVEVLSNQYAASSATTDSFEFSVQDSITVAGNENTVSYDNNATSIDDASTAALPDLVNHDQGLYTAAVPEIQEKMSGPEAVHPVNYSQPSSAAKVYIPAVPEVTIRAALASYDKNQTAARAEAPFAQPDQAAPAPAPGKPVMPMGDLQQIAKLLSASLLPGIVSGISFVPTLYSLSLTGLLVLVVVLGLLVFLSGFIWQLRRSGFRHAPRSDMPTANIIFATPVKMGFAWLLQQPAASPSFCGVRNKSYAMPRRKGGEYICT
jgi:hypothetical protein